ncbi:MAG: hypothetical protein H0T40_15110 [Geodermatophilaceae bacterium]|nr:hypothetical protein [Geodermatophilaceae bacterium]
MSATEGSDDIVGIPVRGRVRRRTWRRVSHGLHLPSTGSPRNAQSQAAGTTALEQYRRRVSPLYPIDPRGLKDTDEIRAWSLLLPPGAAFTPLTAAALRGWWLPQLPHVLPVFVAVPDAGWRPRRAGLHVTRHQPDPAHVDRGTAPSPPRSCSQPPATSGFSTSSSCATVRCTSVTS